MAPIKLLPFKVKCHNLKKLFHTTSLKFGFLDCSADAQLDKGVADRFLCLPIPEPKTQISYVWIDGSGLDLRMRSKTLDFIPCTYKDCPNWTFDGSSTFFSPANKSDNYIVPIAMYADPFRRGNNKIVLCETFTPDKKPTKTNHRQACIEVLNKVCDQEVMFGFQQQFYFIGPEGRPYGWPCGAMPRQTGKNYSGLGSTRAVGREIMECIYRCCLYAGIDFHGTTAERAYGQWQALTGPTLSIKAADDLWMVRYIITRVAETFGISASFKANPVRKGGVPSGMHTNFSTKKSRDENGYQVIMDYMTKLEKNHKADQKFFDCSGGDHLKDRLTGDHHTSHLDKFKWGVGDRTASVKISPSVADKKKGFFQDRRPSSCADPYNLIIALVCTCLL
ncbi:glutamine synthetase-like [Anthonomus grandis grandis]|uniref:glutamine synthetase-like n=1 Tax=Anthonomus grandis grandis TaxID=2921223 RepID=UPI00216555F0|nr:glutamine synthetase-like [Anthonomus grandis grandis]